MTTTASFERMRPMFDSMVERAAKLVRQPRTVGNLDGYERRLVDEYRAAMRHARDQHKKARDEGNLFLGMAAESDLNDEVVSGMDGYPPRSLVRVLDILDRIVIPTWEAWPGRVRAACGTFDEVLVGWRLEHEGSTYSRDLGLHVSRYDGRPWDYIRQDVCRSVEMLRQMCLEAAPPLVLELPVLEYE